MAYHSYPTLTQWHMRSVPLPLLDGLDLMYHPGIRLLKCTKCSVFLNPRSAAPHSTNIHWWNMASATRKQLERDFPNPSWTKPYPLVEFGTSLPPIDDLPIVQGWMCIVDECGFIHDNRKSVESHVVNKHHREPEDQWIREVNATKLVLGNPPTWIVVDGELTDPPPVVKRGPPSSPPFKLDEGQWYREEPPEDLSTSTTAVDGFAPGQQRRHRATSERSETASSSRPKVKQGSRAESPAAYPTLEQYLTPCVSHPILDATECTLRLHPGLDLIQCGTCSLFLLPSQVHGHVRTTHNFYIRERAFLDLTETFPNPKWKRPFPDLAVGDGFPRIPGLAVVPAVQCAYEDCGLVAPSLAMLKVHFGTAHPGIAVGNQYLDIRASKFMATKERQSIYIPIVGEADDPGDSARSVGTPGAKPRAEVGTPLAAPPSARQRLPSSRKAAAVASEHLRLPSPPPMPSSSRSAPSGSRKRKREESPGVPGEIDLGILSGFRQQVTAEQDIAVKIGFDKHGRICVKEVKMVDTRLNGV